MTPLTHPGKHCPSRELNKSLWTWWTPPTPPRERFRPAFWATFRPGASAVPFGERVMAPMSRSSTRITSNRRAMSVEVFSTQSLRRSVSRAFSRAIAALTFPRRLDPRLARASLRWSAVSRFVSLAVNPGTASISPVDSVEPALTPRSTPTTSPVPGPGTDWGIAANATCHRPARSRVTRNDLTSSGTRRDQWNRTHPAFGILTSAQRRLRRRTSHCLPRCPTTRNPSSQLAFRQVGRRCVPP
jgi:hypothetical protein